MARARDADKVVRLATQGSLRASLRLCYVADTVDRGDPHNWRTANIR
jgi:hypothetical protein